MACRSRPHHSLILINLMWRLYRWRTLLYLFSHSPGKSTYVPSGLVGLTAAALGANVTLTDLPVNLRLLRANSRTNACSRHGTVPRVRPLVWGERLSAEIASQVPYDMVVATDIFYAREAMPAFLSSLLALAGSHTDVIVGAGRNRHAEDYFFSLAKAHFEIDQLQHRDLHPSYHCADVSLWKLSKLPA